MIHTQPGTATNFHPCSTKRATALIGIALSIVILYDLVLTFTRHRYFQLYLPLFQSIVHVPGSEGTYAQNYQDVWFLKLARHNGWTSSSNGFFVDIGAYDGTWCSNTKLLEEELNWNGACVDFHPHSFEDRKCQVFKNAMSSESNVEVSFSGRGQERTIAFAGVAASTSNATASTSFAGPTLKTINFPDLLRQSGAPAFIQLISIDVEGHEMKVLQSVSILWRHFFMNTF